MTVFLSPEQVVAIHDLQSAQPVRSMDALAGAVARPRAAWADRLLHPSVAGQAAALLASICQAQAFLDGNKRTAWVACDVFLALNHRLVVDVTDADVVTLMDGISRNALDLAAVAAWLGVHTVADARGDPRAPPPADPPADERRE